MDGKLDSSQNPKRQNQDGRFPETRILGELLAIQSVAPILPTAKKLAEFCVQALLIVPGVCACRACLFSVTGQGGGVGEDACRACPALEDAADETVETISDSACGLEGCRGIRVVAMNTSRRAYVVLVLDVDDPETYGIYEPFLNNLGNTLALNLENRVQKDLLEEANRQLQADIAARKQAEKKMQQAIEAAETANRAKGKFLANMSHELRTPLNAILGFSQLMERDPAATESQRENLGIINRSGEHLLALINDVLEVSKIEAGRIALNIQGFDFHRTLARIEEMIRSRAEGKGLLYIVQRDPDLPRYIRTDEPKLRQVLVNLLDNAVKFTTQGGITLSVGTRDQGSEDWKNPRFLSIGVRLLIPDPRPPEPVYSLRLKIPASGLTRMRLTPFLMPLFSGKTADSPVKAPAWGCPSAVSMCN